MASKTVHIGVVRLHNYCSREDYKSNITANKLNTIRSLFDAPVFYDVDDGDYQYILVTNVPIPESYVTPDELSDAIGVIDAHIINGVEDNDDFTAEETEGILQGLYEITSDPIYSIINNVYKTDNLNPRVDSPTTFRLQPSPYADYCFHYYDWLY